MAEKIVLKELNKKEGQRYLGYGTSEPDENIARLINECENELLAAAEPRCIYKYFDIETVDAGVSIVGTDVVFLGNAIKELLTGCSGAFLLCATISSGADRLIKRTQIQDMAKAVIMDAFAAVAVEQVCDSAQEIIQKNFPGKYFTYRFGAGYEDMPLHHVADILRLLNAEKTVGVTVTGSNMMTPLKSVACIIGMSDAPIKTKKRGCISCSMKEKCEFRVRGERCGF